MLDKCHTPLLELLSNYVYYTLQAYTCTSSWSRLLWLRMSSFGFTLPLAGVSCWPSLFVFFPALPKHSESYNQNSRYRSTYSHCHYVGCGEMARSAFSFQFTGELHQLGSIYMLLCYHRHLSYTLNLISCFLPHIKLFRFVLREQVTFLTEAWQ